MSDVRKRGLARGIYWRVSAHSSQGSTGQVGEGSQYSGEGVETECGQAPVQHVNWAAIDQTCGREAT